MHVGRLNSSWCSKGLWYLRSLWRERGHMGREGFKLGSSPQDSKMSLKATEMRLTCWSQVTRHQKTSWKTYIFHPISFKSLKLISILLYPLHHSTSLYNSLCNSSSFSTTYRCIQDHGARKGEVWQCSPSMSMRWRWIKTFPTFLPVFYVRTLSPAKVPLQLPRPIEQIWYIWHDLTLALLLLNAGCVCLVQSRSHVLDLQCKIKIGFEILIPVVS